MSISNKGFIAPLLLILVALFFIGGGSYAYLQTKSDTQPAVVNSGAQATSTVTETVFPVIETGYTWDNEYRKRPDGSQELYKSFLLSPLGKRISVPDIASSRLDGNRLLLANPLDQQKIVSLTYDSFNEGEKMIRIESYDLNTNEFTLLYTINGGKFPIEMQSPLLMKPSEHF